VQRITDKEIASGLYISKSKYVNVMSVSWMAVGLGLPNNGLMQVVYAGMPTVQVLSQQFNILHKHRHATGVL